MSSSAETVANIEELLKQILIWVPALSLIRFKCVSKQWLSLISDPEFRLRHTLRNPNSKISAFFSSKIQDESFKSILLGNHEIPPGWNPFKTLKNSDSVPDESKLRILQSCNGLFLCHIPRSGLETKNHPVYVVNPTTNEFRALSFPVVRHSSDSLFVRYALAFDPSISPHYKVVCVNNFTFYYNRGKHKIDIYSSKTGEWKHLDTPFFPRPSDEGRHPHFMNKAMHFDCRSREGAIYCNGAVHWIRDIGEASLPFYSFPDGKFIRNEADVLHYFDIGQERFLVASATPPVPLVAKNFPRLLTQRYFGECGGCLYLIEIYQRCNTQYFEVMEMETDYSGWFVKYRHYRVISGDLNPIVAALPGQDWNAFVVLCLSGKEETSQEIDDKVEDSSTDLLLHMPGKIISYNLRNKTFNTSIELANKELYLTLGDHNHCLPEDIIFPYMETLACL
ncbi:putative F-box domain-containing protein [Rosa chinensis]|uniref:Putative F-box domain-containing protein n=1 Tax=Rosa chinensis TaxID=74649 RepID=A0A2P6QPL3_ROSCH|nr:F-box protein At5g07610 [Rosa chinensis]PRQ36131.1 putative F-box domain-containing protein [Rosa chinensis]